MTDKQYAADCIEFLRELADKIRRIEIVRHKGAPPIFYEDADKLEEIATSLQVDTQEETK